jgi:hypothetical protein
MAGTIITDFIRADANKLSLNVGNTIIASVNAMGILSNTGNVMISSSGTIEGNNVTYNGSTILSSGRVRSSLQPANSVLQVVTTVKSDTFTMSGSTYTTVTGLTATITPTSANSKILVLLNMNVGSGYYSTNGRLMRGATAIGLGDQVTSRPRTTFALNTYVANQTYEEYHMLPVAVVYLDSPATTNATTYSVQLANYSSYTTAVNRNINFQDNTTYDPTTISTITLMEIAQ